MEMEEVILESGENVGCGIYNISSTSVERPWLQVRGGVVDTSP